jgi:maltooligosyltrehalose trehalohydrolase
VIAAQQSQQGAFPGPGGTRFRIWAPRAQALQVQIAGIGSLPLQRTAGGFFESFVEGVGPGADYQYVFEDGRRRPDPASRLQRGSIHGASTVVDLAYPWTDSEWRGVRPDALVFYELHVGTFTPEGTFEAVVPRLAGLRELGVTAVELMPVCMWDGARGWGYDGALLYAPHAAYGPPWALQRLVDACHAHGLAAFLDVVYNHLGPSGNYLREFGPYFTDRHKTPWGEAVNYDGEGSGPVRDFVVDSALHWLREYHLDGLRLDSVQDVVDESQPHILAELNARAQALSARLSRPAQIVVESGMNDAKVLRRLSEGGWGMAAQWSDDFHHALHTLLTGESQGYYADYGRMEDLATAYRQGFIYTGQRSVYRGRPHGHPAEGITGRRLIVAAQNHDQIGNRAQGDRLAASLPPEALRLAAAATLLSPFTPLLFMGEEYAESAPFQYFTSFPDLALGRAVSEGRRREFEAFRWQGEVPDPQDPATFERSKIQWERSFAGEHALMRRYYASLLALRHSEPALQSDRLDAISTSIDEPGCTLLVRRPHRGGDLLLLLRFSREPGNVALPPGRWRMRIDSWDPAYSGTRTWQLESPLRDGVLPAGPYQAALLAAE